MGRSAMTRRQQLTADQRTVDGDDGALSDAVVHIGGAANVPVATALLRSDDACCGDEAVYHSTGPCTINA